MKDVASFQMEVSPSDVTDEELAKINEHTRKDLSADDVFIFDGVVSDDSLDSFKTRMDPQTTLSNYADDLTRGVSLMSGHDTEKEPYGRSFDSVLQKRNGLTEVIGKFYMLRDSSANGSSTNDLIRNIEGGITRDMSVGFMAGIDDYICSIDGKTLDKSKYFPGDRTKDGKEAFYWIKNGHLREVSTVYKGSNGNAFIQKARQFADKHKLGQSRLAMLQQGLGTRYDELDKSIFGIRVNEDGSSSDNDNQGGNEDMEITIEDVREAVENEDITIEELEELIAELKDDDDDDDDNDSGDNDDDNDRLAKAVKRVFGDKVSEKTLRRVKAEAEDGRSYKKEVVSRAVKARAAVQGKGFNKAHYKEMLRRSDAATVREEAESYEKMKSGKFQSGRSAASKDDDVDEGRPFSID